MADTIADRPDLPDLQARVELGVAWLDEHLPDWWHADRPSSTRGGGPIDLNRLAMQTSCRCVLGQLFGDYRLAPMSLEQAVEYGFDGADTSGVRGAALAEFEALGELWRGVIEARRAEAVTVDA